MAEKNICHFSTIDYYVQRDHCVILSYYFTISFIRKYKATSVEQMGLTEQKWWPRWNLNLLTFELNTAHLEGPAEAHEECWERKIGW